MTTTHLSTDGFPVETGRKFWNNDLRVTVITAVAAHANAYADTGCTQTWHEAEPGGRFDTLDGAMQPFGRLVRYFEGRDAEKYAPGTDIRSTRVQDCTPAPVTADDLVTAITEAPTEDDALAALAGVPRALLDAVADLLYVDSYGRSSAVVRRAIVAEARS